MYQNFFCILVYVESLSFPVYNHDGKRGTSFGVIAVRELKPCSSHIVGFCFVLFFVLVLILT